MMKRNRSAKIRDIVQTQVIETQEELAAALHREGIAVTQATVSRDIKELGLIKIPYQDGRYRYAVSPEKGTGMSKAHINLLFQEAVLRVENSGNMIVIHTLPGSAPSVASAIDHSGLDAVLGTLAGDDTILMVIRSEGDVPGLMARIQGFLEE